MKVKRYTGNPMLQLIGHMSHSLGNLPRGHRQHSSSRYLFYLFLNKSINIPKFSKVCLTPFPFKEKPMLVPIVANQKKSKKNFPFTKTKDEKSIQHSFCSHWLEVVVRGTGYLYPSIQWRCQPPSLGTAQHLRIKPP